MYIAKNINVSHLLKETIHRNDKKKRCAGIKFMSCQKHVTPFVFTDLI